MERKTHNRLVGLAAVAFAVLAGAGTAPSGQVWASGNYSFTNIADTSGPFATFGDGAPSINNVGTVSFWGRLDVGAGGGEGIYTGNGGPVNIIATTVGQFAWFGVSPSISSGNRVAFWAALDSGRNGIFTGTETTVSMVVDDSGPFNLLGDSFGGSPSINSGGTVAFLAWLDDGSRGIYSNGLGSVIVDDSGPFYWEFGIPTNRGSRVVFWALLDDGTGSGIYTGNGGPLTPIAVAEESGLFLSVSPWPSINEVGTVMFWAQLASGGNGLFTGDGGSVSMIVDNSGPFNGFNYGSINSEGKVAFAAALDGGDNGIFTGPDPVHDKVIGNGDELFGSTVLSAWTGREGLNDDGDIVFRYFLANGVQGIGVAHFVPEPGSVGLLALGGVMLRRKCRMSDVGCRM